ncbi:MAG: DNA translocase FtsK [Anaerolineales bacterium]|nr:DNA translocase FtsK [Anaerolineales bacterium]
MPQTPKRLKTYEQNQSPVQSDWLDRLANFDLQYGRLVRDAIGVTLIAFAIMFLLAAFDYTKGFLLDAIAYWLRIWFGWGCVFVLLGIGYLGLTFLRRDQSEIKWMRLIALELASLLTLGLMAIIFGNDLFRAESGMDGGRLGWGLATFMWNTMGQIIGTTVLFIVWLLAVATGLGFWSWLELYLINLAGDSTPAFVSSPIKEEAVKEKAETAKSPASKKKTPAIPAEFRTSLKATNKRDEKSIKPPPRAHDLPPLGILLGDSTVRADERTINQTAGLIMKTLSEFGIPATVIGYRVGPSVTQFAVQPGFIKKPGTDEEDLQQMKVRVAQIASLEKDLALALSAQRLRIEAPVPGKPYVGIEVPNTNSSVVRLRALLEADSFYKSSAPLNIALGRDVSGNPLIADLARMPHLLIAGSTGSGKSVCITSLATCLAMNNTPEELRMVMIDSKMVELIRFNGLPHLYGKVETNLERILGVLRWVVVEMEHRYRLLESAHARDLDAYNRK